MTQKLSMRELVSLESIDASLVASSKKDVLQSLATSVADLLGEDKFAVFDILWERERLGSTGIGQSIAIPHGRIPGLKKVFGFLARLKEPVNFEAIDDKPVDLVFLLLSPEGAGADHLHALASVSRLFRDPGLCKKLRAAKDASAIYRILTEADAAEEAA
ncbi:MAG: PTS IIA-like nitrogen regulatory protein PtsN [Alphaproteobacteria bacterium]|nr:PTS IIA-like nitrogen regulatory protein PtsN [Alphaproteobacteria bacterium]